MLPRQLRENWQFTTWKSHKWQQRFEIWGLKQNATGGLQEKRECKIIECAINKRGFAIGGGVDGWVQAEMKIDFNIIARLKAVNSLKYQLISTLLNLDIIIFWRIINYTWKYGRSSTPRHFRSWIINTPPVFLCEGANQLPCCLSPSYPCTTWPSIGLCPPPLVSRRCWEWEGRPPDSLHFTK